MASTMLPSRAAWPSASVYNPLIRKSGGHCPAGCRGVIFDQEYKSGYLQPGMLRDTEADFCDVKVIIGSLKTIDAAVAVKDGFHTDKLF